VRDQLPVKPYRAGLLLVGIAQLTVTAQALFTPRSFYDDFPLGRGWVSALPEYNEHLIYDYGAYTLGASLGLILAGIWLDRRVVQLAIITWLAGALIHFGYHLTTLDVYAATDDIGNITGLLLYIVIPGWLLWRSREEKADAYAESPRSA
jgi:hypothetical protein